MEDKIIENKTVDATDYIYSIKRIECLLEQLIYQQIAEKHSNDAGFLAEGFQQAMRQVSAALEAKIEALRPSPKMLGV